jgi:HSP20 family protein
MSPFRFRDPFFSLQRFRDEMSPIMEWGRQRARGNFPAINAWSREEDIIVKAELPGFEPEDIEISVEQDSLTLRGERSVDPLKEGETYHRRERWNGKFFRSFTLPFAVETKKVEADFKDGILTVKLPRAAADKPQKIPVKTS